MALGLIEVFGYTTAIVVADAAAKAGKVRIVNIDNNKPAAGDAAEVPLVMIVKMQGDVADVQTAVAAGVAQAEKRGLYITSHIIAREEPSSEVLASLSRAGKDRLKVPPKNPEQSRQPQKH